MGTPASRLKCRFTRDAAFGVRIEAQPLVESCCELVPTDALNPLAAGMMPSGPLSLTDAAALMAASSSISADGLACAQTAGTRPAKKMGMAESESSRPRPPFGMDNRALLKQHRLG